MKIQIKKYLKEKNLVYPKYNNNISRKTYWENRNKIWSKYIFEKFNDVQKKVCNIKFSEFIEYFFFDKKTYKNGKPLIFLNKSVKDFCKIETRKPPITSCVYKFWHLKMSEYIIAHNLKTSDNFNEMKYIIKNNLKESPKCKYCAKNTHWSEKDYHIFCSQSCQIKYHNSNKELKLSNFDDSKIRKIINEIPIDIRNVTNTKIADVYMNIHNYSEHYDLELSDKEKIYIYLNEIQKKDIICICGNKKKFISQKKGYFNTCTRKKCISVYRGCENIIDDSFNTFVSKNGTKMLSGYLYVCRAINDIYKIGITKTPGKRLNSYKNIFTDFNLIYSVYIPNNLYKLEKELQNKYMEKRAYIADFDGKTETFQLNKQDLLEIKRKICEFEN